MEKPKSNFLKKMLSDLKVQLDNSKQAEANKEVTKEAKNEVAVEASAASINDEKKIINDLKVHLDKTAEELKLHDGWEKLDMPSLSENELLKLASKHDLQADAQTRSFCKFISIGTNFASMNFKNKIQTVPDLVISIKDLIGKMEQEIKDFAEIASYFQNLILSFVKLVMNTQHNMRMALPHLNESIVHMSIMADALKPDSEKQLEFDDLLDIDLALTNMSFGIKMLLEHAKSSKQESNDIDARINALKENIESKITVSENRIGFANILPKLGLPIGMITGASTAGVAVETAAFGGAGALVLGSFSFPPIGAVLVASAIGALGIGSVLFLIVKLWEKHQFKALGYLRKILDKLNKLNSANLAFMQYMNKSEEEVNQVLTGLDMLKTSVKSGSQRYRKLNAGICNQAIESTKNVIENINKINEIDLKSWIDTNETSFSLLSNEINSICM